MLRSRRPDAGKKSDAYVAYSPPHEGRAAHRKYLQHPPTASHFFLSVLSPLFFFFPKPWMAWTRAPSQTATGASGLSSGGGAGSGRPLLSSGSNECGVGRIRAELAVARAEAAGHGRPLLRRRSPLRLGAGAPGGTGLLLPVARAH
jgi:hypothetical protein